MEHKFQKLCLAAVISSAVLLMTGCKDDDRSSVTPPVTPPTGDVQLKSNQVAIYYKRDGDAARSAEDYQGWGLHLWDNDGANDLAEGVSTGWPERLRASGVHETKGAYYIIDLNADRNDKQAFSFIMHNGQDDKNCPEDLVYSVSDNGQDVYTVQNSCEIMDDFEEGLDLAPNQVAIYYFRKDGGHANWGLHLWSNDGHLAEGQATDWSEGPKMPDGEHETKGAYYIIDLATERNDEQTFSFIIRDQSGNKDCGDRVYSLKDNGKDAYTMQGTCEVSDNPLPLTLLENAAAHFLDKPALVWNAPAGAETVELVSSATGGIKDNADNTDLDGEGLGRITLVADGILSTDVFSPYPAFGGMQKWKLPESVTEAQFKALLKGQLVVLAKDQNGIGMAATRLQFPFALDGLYFNETNLKNEKLGASFEEENVSIRLWAPTARKVTLQVAQTGGWDAKVQDLSMQYDETTGVWHHTDTKAVLDRKFYRYQIEVYRRDTDKVETVTVTDPYSLNVSADGAFTHIVNLNDADTQPSGWSGVGTDSGLSDTQRPENIVVYEAHIRDISNSDKAAMGVDLANNGKYKAFAEDNRASMTHLRELAQDGMTYFQVLPAFDIATVNEAPEKVANLGDDFDKLCELNPAVKDDADFGGYCGGSETIGQVFEAIKDDDEKPQALNNYLRMHDSFNWGYDPFHYTVPEGSYASSPDGVARIKEFREMVVALDSMGLRVAMDVVYNHTNAAGIAPKSVLDKIVPDYYQRLDITTGAVETSSCCANTASEQKMMAKLMEDSLAVWTEDYKVDAYRFDLMGLHLKQNMVAIRDQLTAKNPAMYLYGEGWTMGFGGGASDGDKTATQVNMAGTGIGTFSDRLRDAVRGGGPFDGGNDIRKNQGFGSGAWEVPNELNATPDENALKNQMDLIRVGLAGNLADYTLTNYKGQSVKGSEVDYNGAPGGYTANPMENVGYVSKHDNQTLWDNHQYKLAESLTSRERTQMQILSQALPILSQGVPFIHMGAELMRSKSMQRDSYDSGDWFNRVNFDLDDENWNNNWNVGLPRADKDGSNWPLIRTINANGKALPTADDAQLSVDMMREYLSIRKDSGLFQLQTAEDVQKVVKFYNTGAGQVGGVIVMELDNTDDTVAGDYESIVVMINATAEAKSYPVAHATGYGLHTKHQNFGEGKAYGAATFADGVFNVPARSVAVFVKGTQTQ
ncbi:pullulanase-type alpha-1,6-glucosidase [Endozoicomonas acroporae]|uniref:pullulanase-type alpha-1,6-glucosidase n=1 Tax=Endozoicomonas acroporae TaxID=1701104 RepID=UPI000C77F43C|nr:pullulanase-type alpha-1,6-glucosidase [Endozoicomonas acroporae]